MEVGGGDEELGCWCWRRNRRNGVEEEARSWAAGAGGGKSKWRRQKIEMGNGKKGNVKLEDFGLQSVFEVGSSSGYKECGPHGLDLDGSQMMDGSQMDSDGSQMMDSDGSQIMDSGYPLFENGAKKEENSLELLGTAASLKSTALELKSTASPLVEWVEAERGCRRSRWGLARVNLNACLFTIPVPVSIPFFSCFQLEREGIEDWLVGLDGGTMTGCGAWVESVGWGGCGGAVTRIDVEGQYLEGGGASPQSPQRVDAWAIMDHSGDEILEVSPLCMVSGLLEEGKNTTVDRSEWVMDRMKKFSKFMKVDITDHEEEAMCLFMAIEARWRAKGGPSEVSKIPAGSVKKGMVVEQLDVTKGEFTLSCKFKCVEDGLEWMYSGVYGPNRDSDRRLLWEELAGIGSWWSLPWCIGGDFNVVRFPSERRAGGGISSTMWDFSDFISDQGLLDLPLVGGRFTWSSNQENPAMSRLDRFLVSPDWDTQFSTAVQSLLPRTLSDHSPILLDCGPNPSGKSPFRFENMWLRSEGFVERVKHWWESYLFEGSPGHILSQKLKALKADLRQWNKDVFGDVGVRKGELMREIQQLDALEESRTLSEGDRNTKFFHRMANSHWRNNFIGCLNIEGTVTSDPKEVEEGIVQYYKHLYCESTPWRPTLNGLPFKTLVSEEANSLILPFGEDEVLEAVRCMSGDKAPGPDGFTMAFYQACWGVVKTDVMRVMHYFYQYGTFAKSLNATFVVLIPKKAGAIEMKDFRPISLVGSMYKIISKILDSVLIASECVDSRVRDGTPGVLCKLDLEKAYDHVNWDFLLALLHRCGFPETWQESSRGLRQGDSLSPLLFVVVMEALNKLLMRAEEGHFLRGFEVQGRNNNPLMISNLLFADDTLIFYDADIDQIGYLKCTLLCFEAVSGLRVNLGKSEMVPIGNVPNIQELAAMLECRISALPMNYLGLPLGARYKSKALWDPVLEKMGRKLAGWKKLYLSKGARLTLIKSTVSSLPVYFLSLFPIPASVNRRIERLQREFLWGGMGDAPKFPLVNWKTVCQPVYCGGLGIKNHAVLNQALLGKWLWRFMVEHDSLWKQGWDRFSSHLKFVLGCGSRIRFWLDLWCGEVTLSRAFPLLFRIAQSREARVAEYLCWQNGVSHWDVRFTSPSRSGYFEVKSYYKILSLNTPLSFPWKSIWKVGVPPRVAFFVWTAAHGKILTMDNLRKRRICIVDWCCMCKHSGESPNHLLLHCETAQSLWSMVFCLFGVVWVMPGSVMEVMASWMGSFRKSSHADV
uniref:Reverse transcriptase domain-containing protein n=1 Tax=Fagus sylvatica TaxID=28930 RepID=A0A2N9I908_FAGSY